MSGAEDAFREAMARWASGVAVAAVRDDGRVYATTVSSFASISADPPQVVLSLSPGAQVLPFLRPDAAFGVSVLAASQRRLATVFADPLPVGPSPWPADGPLLLPGALVGLVCHVASVHEAPPARLVVGRVEESRLGGEEAALLHWRRGWRALE